MKPNQFSDPAFASKPADINRPGSFKRERAGTGDRTRSLIHFLPLSLTLEGFHVCGGPSL
jgi:hypothetical protein